MSKVLKFPTTDYIRAHLGFSNVAHGEHVSVLEDAYKKWEGMVREQYRHLCQAEQHALTVLFCLTHPDHKQKHFEVNHPVASRKQKLVGFLQRDDVATLGKWLFAIAVLLMLAAISAHAQRGTSRIDVIQFQHSDNSPVKTFAGPFTIKEGANTTFSIGACPGADCGKLLVASAAGAGGSPGGSNTQVQYNNAGAFAGISTMTTDGTIVTAKVGSNWLFVDPTDTTKKFHFDASNIAAGQDRKINVPNADSTTVQPDTGAANNFLTAVSAQGVISKAQPAFTNLSGSLACTQHPALTGDVTSSAGACATTNVNLPDGVTQAGHLLATNIAAPATPATGKDKLFVDSTDKRFHDKNDAGSIGTTVVADTGTANNFLTAVSAAGAISKARPTCANLSDSAGGCSMSTTAGGDLSGTLPSPTVAQVNGVAYPASPSTDSVPVTTAANTETYKAIPDCDDASGNHLNYDTTTHAFTCGTTDSHVGTVTSVSGTANEITSSGGATPTLSIASTFDIHGKTSTAPIKAGTGASAPGSCQANVELYIKTDATAGQQVFICNGAGNGWVLVGDGGGGGGMTNPMTTTGDIIYSSDNSGTPARLGIGGANTVLHGGTTPSYAAVTSADTTGTFAPNVHNLLSASHGDTTAAAAVRGDGIFAIGATPTWQRLAHSSATGGYFKWNGTDIVASTLAASGTGSPTACSNQVVTAFTLNADAAPTSTCATVTSASTSGTFAPNAHNLLSASHGDTAAASPVLGDALYANSTPAWTKLAGATQSDGGGFFNEVQAALAVPSAPTLSTCAITGGSLATARYYVVVTLVNAFGETTQSAETECNVSSGAIGQIVVAAPTLTGNATGYSVYIGSNISTTAAERGWNRQTGCVNISTSCTINSLSTTIQPPMRNTASNGTTVIPTFKGSTGGGNAVLDTGATINPAFIDGKCYADNVLPGDSDYAHKINYCDAYFTQSGAAWAGEIIVNPQLNNATAVTQIVLTEEHVLKTCGNLYVQRPIMADNYAAVEGCTPSDSNGYGSRIVANAAAAPSAPTLATSTSGGSLPATTQHFVRITFNWPDAESPASAEANITTGAGATNSITVTAPTLPSGATGYTVWSETTTNTEKKQTASNACVNITANCVIQVKGTGATFSSKGNIDSLIRALRQDSTTEAFYVRNTALAGNSGNITFNKAVLDLSATFEPTMAENLIIDGWTGAPGILLQDASATDGNSFVSIRNIWLTSSGNNVDCIKVNHDATNGLFMNTNNIDHISCVNNGTGKAIWVANSSPAGYLRQLTVSHVQHGGSTGETLYIDGCSRCNFSDILSTTTATNAVTITSNTNNLINTFDRIFCEGPPTNCINDSRTTRTITRNQVTHYESSGVGSDSTWFVGMLFNWQSIATPGSPITGDNYSDGTSLFLQGLNYRTTVGFLSGSAPPACTAGTAGFWCAAEGTAFTNVASTAGIYPDSTSHEYMAKTNGASTAGMILRSQPGAIHVTGQTATKTIYTLCAASAGACNTAGQYAVDWYFNQGGTACSSVTAGSVTFALTWTDNAGAHSAVALPMNDQLSTTATSTLFHFTTSNTTAWASGHFNIWSTGAAAIQITNTYVACTTGTGTWELAATATRVQ